GTHDQLIERTTQASHFGVTGPAAEFARPTKTFGEEFAGTPLEGPAKGLTKVGQAPGLKHVREKGFQPYANVVFNEVNGRIEQMAKTGMLGRTLKRSPLMEQNLIGLSNKAITDAA